MMRIVAASSAAAAIVAAGLLAVSLGAAQKMPWQAGDAGDDSHQSVHFLYPEQVTVTAKKESVVDLHFKINPGMHINSHEPREKSFIPTQLMVIEPPGLTIGPVEFPPGANYALAAMPQDKLSVYTGEFVIHAHIHADAGEHLLEGVLRYQACDTNSCYPPRKAPVAVDVIAK
jgi:DsbC/DsbD-like thiol-disulfide interchange protein